MDTIIRVKDLSLQFPLRYGTVKALRNVSIDIPRGKVTALVGESGSGKTTLATALMKLVSFPGEIPNGEIWYEGQDVLKMTDQQLHKYRWEEIAMVFQAAQSALNPVMRVRDIIIETYLAHKPKTPEKVIIVYGIPIHIFTTTTTIRANVGSKRNGRGVLISPSF